MSNIVQTNSEENQLAFLTLFRISEGFLVHMCQSNLYSCHVNKELCGRQKAPCIKPLIHKFYVGNLNFVILVDMLKSYLFKGL